jgi:hypothetical protein
MPCGKWGSHRSKQTLLGFTSHSKTPVNAVWIFSQEKTREKLAEMIIQHEYPFAIVEHEGFIDFMHSAQPNFSIPGRKTIRNDCIRIFEKMKAIQIAMMTKSKAISLSTDLWTASDLTGYMVVTTHYITKKWELHKSIIGF